MKTFNKFIAFLFPRTMDDDARIWKFALNGAIDLFLLSFYNGLSFIWWICSSSRKLEEDMDPKSSSQSQASYSEDSTWLSSFQSSSSCKRSSMPFNLCFLSQQPWIFGCEHVVSVWMASGLWPKIQQRVHNAEAIQQLIFPLMDALNLDQDYNK